MFRRKRRKVRGVWLPNVGTPSWSPGNPVGTQPGYIDNVSTVTLGGGRTPTLEFALFEDGNSQQLLASAAPQDEATKGLNDLIEWGYSLRRIVGSINISVATPVQDVSAVPLNLVGLTVCAALIVRKTNALGGGQSLAAFAGDINPLTYENVRDPWIWRRCWRLQNSSVGVVAGTDPAGTTTDAEAVLGQLEYTPADYGDIRSGGHVDAKTRRVVGPEERVFLDVSFNLIPTDNGTPTDWSVCTFFDYRGFATLRSNQGNRRNSVR